MKAYEVKKFDINKENLRRWQKESEIFSKMLVNLSSLNIKRIDISGDRNNNKHDGISEDKLYLALHNGEWIVSKAYKSYHGGWELDAGHYHMGIRMFDIVFEIYIPNIQSKPLKRLVVNRIEDECWCHCEDCCTCEYEIIEE